MFERWFQLEANGTTTARELRAGVTTFLTMAYILAVNPQILGEAGMPRSDVFFATAVAAAIGSAAMALLARYPFALAPGMGLNAYFAYSVVLGAGIAWQTALGAVFIEGLLFLVLAITGARRLLVEAVPRGVQAAIPAGIGLFLLLIGLQNAGVVVDHPATLLALGDLGASPALFVLGGFLLTAALTVRHTPGALLIGMLATTAALALAGGASLPERWLEVPALPEQTLFAFDLGELLSGPVLIALLAFLLVDLLDTAGTLVGVADLGGFLDDEGRLPRANRAFTADAVATSVGAVLGTSTTTTYIESAAGVEEGGRTGLTALVVAGLFVAALFFAPALLAIPAAATAPALIVVGLLMTRALQRVDWQRTEELLPALVTALLMPLTYSIANGIAAGLLTWLALRIFTGRAGEVRWQTWLLCGVVGALLLLAR